MPNIRWLLAFITWAHRAVYRGTRGWLGSRGVGSRFALVHHRGRRSGLLRATPLLCVEDGAGVAVVASNGGDERPPAWWLNLQADPHAEVWLGRRRFAARAHRATPAEEARLWPKLVASYRFFERYRARTRREIPVVVLEPLPDGAPR